MNFYEEVISRLEELQEEEQRAFEEFQKLNVKSNFHNLPEYKAWQKACNAKWSYMSYVNSSKLVKDANDSLLKQVKDKYPDADQLYVEIDSHLESLSWQQIKDCFDASATYGLFVKCLESKKYL